MPLRAETRRLFDDFVAAPLLSNVGKPRCDPSVVFLTDEAEVKKSLLGLHWDDYQRSLINGFHDDVRRKGVRFWNDIVKEKHQELQPILAELKPAAQIPFDEPELQETIRFLQLHFLSARLFESELQEHLRRSYYQQHFDWFLQGRLPCGWQGTITFPCLTDEELQTGKLLIY